MSATDIPDEWVEKAALVLHEISCADDECGGGDFGTYLDDGRAVIAAVADDIRAQTLAPVLALAAEWESGYYQGSEFTPIKGMVHTLRAVCEQHDDRCARQYANQADTDTCDCQTRRARAEKVGK